MVKSPEGKVDGLTKGGKDLKSKDAIKDLKHQKKIKEALGEQKNQHMTTSAPQTWRKRDGSEERLVCQFLDHAGQQAHKQASCWNQ